MAVLYDNNWSVKQYGYSNPHLLYRLVVTLNSQNKTSKTSNITCKVYQKTDGNGGYGPGNDFVFLSLSGHTSAATTDVQYVAPVNIGGNRGTDWEELSSLAYTANFAHKTDGTLTVCFKLKIDRTTSTNAYVPVNTTLDTGDITVPTIASTSKLGTVSDWYCVDKQGNSNMSFPFTTASGAQSHQVKVVIGGLTVATVKPYTSNQSISISNDMLAKILSQIGAGGSTKRQATVTLTTYDSDGDSAGTDSKTFYIIGCGIDIKQGGTWRNGILWKKVNGSWKCGIVWVKVNGVWKKGVRL